MRTDIYVYVWVCVLCARRYVGSLRLSGNQHSSVLISSLTSAKVNEEVKGYDDRRNRIRG